MTNSEKNETTATTQLEWLGEVLYSIATVSSSLQFVVDNCFTELLPPQLSGLPNLLEVISEKLCKAENDLCNVHQNMLYPTT